MVTPAIPEGTHVPSPETVLSTLANEQRRAVLRALEDAEGDTMSLDALSAHVASEVGPNEAGAAGAAHRQRVRTALYHVHLPKLDACGMVVHDTDALSVRTVLDERGRELLSVADPDGSSV